MTSIRAIDGSSIHQITSGQVVIDLQTAVKELVENSLDAGATNIEVRFKEYGLTSIEVIDNGCGIAEADYDSIALKHHTSKLTSLSCLTTLTSFGFRGEALSSLCALCESVVVTTATEAQKKGVGCKLEMGRGGEVVKRGVVARQRGTTITLTKLFDPLPVRRKEFERNAKREFGKAMGLLTAYALVPCSGINGDVDGTTDSEGDRDGDGDEDQAMEEPQRTEKKKAWNNKAVRLTVTNTPSSGGKKQTHILSAGGSNSNPASLLNIAQGLWGSKSLEGVTGLELQFRIDPPKVKVKVSAKMKKEMEARGSDGSTEINPGSGSIEDKIKSQIRIKVHGLISKFTPGDGRTGTDRQFFYVNGRPCALGKIQKAFNEVYRSFNANQAPFVVADFIVPRDAVDINVSPDKRTIFLHSEDKLVAALKAALEEKFSATRSTYTIHQGQTSRSSSGGGSNVSAVATAGVGDLGMPDEDMQTDQTTMKTKGKGKGKSLDTQKEPQQSKSKTKANDDELNPEHKKTTEHSYSNQEQDGDTPFGQPHLLVDEAAQEHEVNTVLSDDHSVLGKPELREDSKRPAQKQKQLSSSSSQVAPVDIEVEMETDSVVEVVPDSEGEVCGPSAAPRTRLARTIPDTSTAVQDPTTRRHPSTSNSIVTSHSSNVSSSRGTESGNSTLIGGSNTNLKRPAVQMVLNTAGASWSFLSDVTDEPPRKKGRVPASGSLDAVTDGDKGHGIGNGNNKLGGGKGTRRDFKERLMSFAREGTQAAGEGKEDEEGSIEGGESDEEIDELEEDDSLQTSGVNRENKKARSRKSAGDTPMDIDSCDGMIIHPDTRPTVGKTSLPNLSNLVNDTLFDDDCSEDLTMVDPNPVISEPIRDSETPSADDVIMRPEIIRSLAGENMSMRFDFSRVSESWRVFQEQLLRQSEACDTDVTASPLPSLQQDAGVSNIEDDSKAAEALSRVIDKEDFGSMDIIGQFNLGFIVTRRKKAIGDGKGEMDDLFIVDQHAADEKYNFETLQQTTTIKSQKLFRPQPLELTAADEMLAIENMGVLRQNGFEVDVDDDTTSGLAHRLKLVAQPVSKSTVFDMKDLEELLHLMHDLPTGQMVRCSKARAMFAMRACRKSVMVGRPLTKSQMTSVVHHMGTMDQPWNCPHGRPTMRHLSDIANMGKGKTRPVNWVDFGTL